MVKYSSLLICLIGFNCYYFTLCDFDKNSTSAVRSLLRNELTKNQVDRFHVNHTNIPNITGDLLSHLYLVKDIEVEFCNVKSIEDGSFDKHIYTLRKINLKHNLLEEIRDNIFSKLVCVEDLDLSYNQIKVISKSAFAVMFALRNINLSNNRIEVYENSWFQYLAVCSYNFENNLIKSLPEMIGSRFISREFVVKYSDCTIDLIFSHNCIEKIDEEAFNTFTNIRKLYLDNNAISNIANETFNQRAIIKDLRLDHNRIVCMTPDTNKVKEFNVSENPWDKECLNAFKEKINEQAEICHRCHKLSFMLRFG